MADLGIFTNDKFSLQSLTAAINEQQVPKTRIAELGLFAEDSITTTSATIERRQQALSLVASATRGSNGATPAGSARSLLTFQAPHLPVTEIILADSVQNVRAFGTASELQTIQGQVNDRLRVARARLDATIEYHRMGAIKGLVLDADGTTVIHDIYNQFGIARPTKAIAFSTASTDVRKEIIKAKRMMEDGLQGLNYSGVRAFAGAEFMDALTGHQSTKDAYNRWQDGSALRDDVRNSFGFGGVIFEEYRLAVGGQNFVADNEAYFFPEGAFEMFKTSFAPADYIETVNTPGLPYYAKQWLTDNSGKSVTLQAQSNPVCLCLRPAAVIKLTMS